MTSREEVQNLLTYFQPTEQIATPESLIEVSTATKRIAFAYERFRNTLEPDEEEILRRKAIRRVLERRLFEDRPPVTIATTLLQEMIRGNYVKSCPKSLAEKVGLILKKAKQVYTSLSPDHAEWFLQLVAVAIDHELFPPSRQEALVHIMYKDTYKRVVWTDNFVAADDRPMQLYLGCHRALFAADNSELAYHYFMHHFPEWKKSEISTEDVNSISKKLPQFHTFIEGSLNHPARDRLTRLLRPVAVPYLALRDMIVENQEAAFDSDDIFNEAAHSAISGRIRKTRDRMSKRAWHSILFLFLTKTLLAFFVEIPYERFLLGQIHYLALATNVAFHPLLLFVLATTVRLPGQRNTERVVDQLKNIVSGEGELPTVMISSPRRYGTTTWSVFAIFYAVMFLVIFWALFSFLDRLDFSLLAMFFFVIFLGLVSFLATRIRRSADDLRVIPRGETVFSAITSFFALPVLEFGRWLAQNIKQLNVLLFLMDRVLEAPFKILIDITEEWFDFIRDRREEIVK
jgi:hypothetical protein